MDKKDLWNLLLFYVDKINTKRQVKEKVSPVVQKPPAVLLA